MSFTYAQLETAIQDFTENSETSFVTNLPVFIRGAEDRIFTLVDLELFRKNATSQLTIGDPYLNVPLDYLAPFSLQITTANYQEFLEFKDVNFSLMSSKMAASLFLRYESGNPIFSYRDSDSSFAIRLKSSNERSENFL